MCIRDRPPVIRPEAGAPAGRKRAYHLTPHCCQVSRSFGDPRLVGTQTDRMRDPRANPWSQIRDGVLVAVAIVVITYFHYYPPHQEFISHESLHILLRRLYYIPILYSAYRFGIKGGLLASISVTALFIPHAIISLG